MRPYYRIGLVGLLSCAAAGLAIAQPCEWLPGEGEIAGGDFPGVNALAAYNGELVAGGSFETAGGELCNGIAGWDGSAWHALGSGMEGPSALVAALTIYQDELIAAGRFTTAGGVSCSKITRWNGSIWQPLGSGIPGDITWFVSDLTAYDGELIAAGLGGWRHRLRELPAHAD